MFDLGGSPVFVFVPFVAFSVVFLLVILLRSCFIMSRDDVSVSSQWSRSSHRRRRPRCRTATTTTHSTASVEIQTNAPVPPAPYVPPPGYYSEVMATDSSAMYPVYIPSYNGVSSSPLPSLRDPRRFQGLHGVAAPPPYPSPPTYNQIAAYPELPSVNTARLDNRSPSRGGKKNEIAPVE